MAPDIRLAAVLFGSFALWLPALTGFLAGGLDAGAVTTRYAASLAGTWLAVTILGAIVRGYRVEPDGAATTSEGRANRRSDVPITSPDGPPGEATEPDLAPPAAGVPSR